MGVIDNLGSRNPGVVFAVDEELRVVECSPGAKEHLRLAATEVLGRRCHELISLVDSDTGHACHETCPLVPGNSRPGWLHSRVLDVNVSRGDRLRVDCLLLRLLTPGSGQSNLCLLSTDSDASVLSHSRVLQAIEAASPAVSGLADLREVLAVSLKAVVRSTAAQGGEVFLLDPDTHELMLSECQGLSFETMKAFRESAAGDRSTEPIMGAQLPVLATVAWPYNETAGVWGSYLCAPLVAEGRVLGGLAIAGRSSDFDVATATRVMFTVAAQLGGYLRRSAHRTGKDRTTASEGVREAETPRLRVSCLGPFVLTLDGAPLPLARFRRLKAVALLKFLVTHRGRGVPREAAMEALWPEADPSQAGANLRVVLHALRRGLEPGLKTGEASSFVTSEGELVYLGASNGVSVDSEEFVRLARHGAQLASLGRIEESITEFRDAAALYLGDFMEDDPYTDWGLFERERLREVYITLLKHLASLLFDTDDAVGAVEICRTALRVDRGREEVHRDLMLFLDRSGRRDEALRQYEICRTTLREEIGIEPGPETQAVYAAMLTEGVR